jgi:hypothetical protein
MARTVREFANLRKVTGKICEFVVHRFALLFVSANSLTWPLAARKDRAVGEFVNVRVVHSAEDLLLQLGGELDKRIVLLRLAVVCVGEHSHLARRSVGGNPEEGQ